MSTALVTVGTTYFDELISEVNKPIFHASLYRLGYRKLIVQYGSGTVTPVQPTRDAVTTAAHGVFDRAPELKPLVLEKFQYKDDLEQEFTTASLIISHGGAGTCMQALTPFGKRRLIIVVNETLMNNHQKELAHALYAGRHALVTTPSDLNGLLSYGSSDERFCPDVVRLLGPSIPPAEAGFVGFKRGNPERLTQYINQRLRA
ncbi:unnamed protein product [Calicophoron daubneyi]|uniref:UDP-N-acetylglucosamine transferase subunit ALG13 n=1 Tax=Calicophoron daubneyi TaxID=300641 RepID=A0AAV2TEG6_CALDB